MNTQPASSSPSRSKADTPNIEAGTKVSAVSIGAIAIQGPLEQAGRNFDVELWRKFRRQRWASRTLSGLFPSDGDEWIARTRPVKPDNVIFEFQE